MPPRYNSAMPMLMKQEDTEEEKIERYDGASYDRDGGDGEEDEDSGDEDIIGQSMGAQEDGTASHVVSLKKRVRKKLTAKGIEKLAFQLRQISA